MQQKASQSVVLQNDSRLLYKVTPSDESFLHLMVLICKMFINKVHIYPDSERKCVKAIQYTQ